MNSLRRLLPEAHIQVVESVENWQKAVEIASAPLRREELISQTYVENMKKSIKENGPYMVLTDYFALLHARPGMGVNKQSMSLLVSKEPVDLEGKPVKIFLVLAAKDNQSHIDSLQDLMTVFMDEEKYQMILAADKKTIVELFD